jgi:NADH:ubiquinone oxidoreductase subunit 5 (subunit L)/multisubunit Na+/H+ antiporter MnhA subunit
MLFSGPYAALWVRPGFPQSEAAFWIVALSTVFLTAAYLTRAADTWFQRAFSLSGTLVRPRFFSVPHVLIAGAWALVLMAFLFAFPAWFRDFIAPALAPTAAPLPGGGPPAPVMLLLPVFATVGGWAFALSRKPRPLSAGRPAWVNRLYVLFWNKLYFDELYAAYFVAPNLGVARALNSRVERAVIDRALDLLGSASIGAAFWLWRVLEGRGVNRAVSGTVAASMSTARWLWRVLEGRAIQGSTDHFSHQVESVGRYLQHKELHTLQEHLLLVVSGLAALLGLFYLVIHSMG